MFERIRADTRRLREIKKRGAPWYVLESLLFENGYQAVLLYRLGSWFKRHRLPMLGPFFARLSLLLTGVDLSPGAEIGGGLMISHGVGLVVGNAARMGTGVTLLHQVTIGAASTRRIAAMPRLGDDVYIGAGARLIGDITVGDRVFIGTNAIVTQDLPSDCKAVVKPQLQIVERRSSGPEAAP